MSTTIRPEISKRNESWISRHRYYELKHFCMQYFEWRKWLEDISVYPRLDTNEIHGSEPNDPTVVIAIQRERYLRYIDLVEATAKEVDEVLGVFVLKGIVYGISYDLLRAKTDIPCCKEKYYELYRRFFSILDKKRDA